MGHPRRSLWRTLWKDVLLLGAGNFSYAVGQLGFRSILVVTLVPALYGRLSLVLSIYSTLWLVASGGLPNGVARQLAIARPEEDAATTRAVFKATLWPTVLGSLGMGVISDLTLDSTIAAFVGAVGFASLVYATVTIGILRGRHRVGPAASVMPVTALGEVLPLAALLIFGGVTTLSAFSAFCFGNVIGLTAGLLMVIKTRPEVSSGKADAASTVTPRQLLGLSVWLAIAGAGMAFLPFVLRVAASLDSYSQVAIADIALVLFAIPQRLGSLMAVAITPHASRSVRDEAAPFTISRREQVFVTLPFVIGAAILALTPLASVAANAVGRPEYSRCGTYLSLVLLAGPARVLYGIVAGILIGHGDGRFLGLSVILVTTCAAGLMFAAAALGQVTIAFAILVPAFWLIYFLALHRLDRLQASLPQRSG